MSRSCLATFGMMLCLAGLAGPLTAQGGEPLPETVQFNRDIRPILSDTCYTCHGPDAKQRATALRFDQEESAKGDQGGFFAIVPGKLAESELWLRIGESDPADQMPPPTATRQLQPREKDLLKRWIEQGAVWQKHWSFEKPQRAELPAVAHADQVANPIDQFLLARLEREGWTFSPPASRETLIRRVTLDLTGLPPTLAEIDAFLADQEPGAYERVVDRLLASPRYGERMVLEWLDAARYADSNGYQTDGTRAMWPWRDWVITALNNNMPFDQFTVEQVAGDLLPEPTREQRIATGFNRNHMLNGEGGRIAEESRNEYVVDRVETTSTVWLGLTLGCARCHDHKYDPFTQKEFYQLYAYFNNVSETGGVDRRSGTAAPTIELPTPDQTAKIAELELAIKTQEPPLEAKTTELRNAQPDWERRVDAATLPDNIQVILGLPADVRNEEQKKQLTEHYLASVPELVAARKQLDDTRKQLNDTRNSVLITMVMEERPERRETFVLSRGLYDKPGDKVTIGVPAVLPALSTDAPTNRLALARWLVSPEQPLTARVTVNRVWQMFFGTGLVKTVEDFGAQGELPTHPELLDWLAVEFQSPQVMQGPGGSPAGPWDMKALHRLIVLSRAYQQQSAATPEQLERDPENRLLARGPRYRLSAYALRDQALAVSGLLVDKVGGPPVRPYQPAGIWEDFSFGKITYQQDHGESLYRRSLYTFWRRSVGPTMMFDTSARQVCTVRNPRTNTPLHALILLNDITFVEAARVFAEKLILTGGTTPAERLERAFRMVTSRRPTATEQAILLRALERARTEFSQDRAAAEKLVATGEFPRDPSVDVVELAAYTALTNLLLNLDEAVTRE